MMACRWGLVLGIVALTSTSYLQAWDAQGHRLITGAAVELLAGETPRFLQESRDPMAWDSIDPDLMRNRDLPQLRDRENPDHYLDLELVQDRHLPATRSEFVRQLAQQEAKSTLEEVGALPYAVVEATQRLIFAFAQLRHQPANEHLQAKVTIYAAQLAHYAQDLCQPLHSTIHYDGRALEDQSSPYTGFHQQVDRLVGQLNQGDGPTLEGVELRELGPLFPAILEELERSHSQVKRLYGLEEDIVALAGGGELSIELRSLARERYRAAVLLTARLISRAWRESTNLRLPNWGFPE